MSAARGALWVCALLWASPSAAQDAGETQEPETATEWNDAGVAALEAGELDGAIQAFRAAQVLAPDDAVIAINLSRAFGHRGRGHYEAGRLPEALVDFRTAADVDRDGGVPEVMMAQAELRLGQRDVARDRLTTVRADFPENREAVRLLADLLAVSGRLVEAVALLEQALEQHPGLEPRLAQLREERRAWEGFLTDSSAHFDVRYDPMKSELVADLPEILADLEDAYQAVAEELGLMPTDRILVLVLDRERYRGDAPEWSGALYDGRIRLSVGDYDREKHQVRATLRHEYAHAALHRLGPPLPTWLQEGIAQWVEGRPAAQARAALRERKEIPLLASLDGEWTGWSERESVSAAYDQALSFCAFLREQYGPTAFRLLFENVRAAGFEDGFTRTFAKPLVEVEKEYSRALRW